MYRVEDKYICSNQELFSLQSRLECVLESDSNQRDSRGYVITSVYFDDLYDSHMQDTVDGNKERSKYRIRIYNHSLDAIKLEVKYKKYSRIFKISKTITKEQMDMLLSGQCIDESCMSMRNPITLFNIAIKKRGLRPKVIVEYERKAYVFGPGNVRITFDRNLRYSTQVEQFGKRDTVFCQVREFPNVLEVKYDELLPGFIAQLLEIGNLNQTSYSKYRICRES